MKQKLLNIRVLFYAFPDVQYRLRHPSSTALRGPPSPKIREKAKSLCNSLICTANNIHYYNSVGQRGIFLLKLFCTRNGVCANFFQ